MYEVIRIKHLKKDGSVDSIYVKSVAALLKDGSEVLLPIDGIYGFARKAHDSPLKPAGNEYVICDFGLLERRARYNKADYDFLKRVWPDEVSVLFHSQSGSDPVTARMPQTTVSREIVHLSDGAIDFFPLLNEKGKPLYKFSDLEKAAKEKDTLFFAIDEWCRPHQLPTVIDIRNTVPALVRTGRVSMDEISSLFYLGPSDEVG